jgi:tRNA(Ile)-lysidine synthase
MPPSVSDKARAGPATTRAVPDAALVTAAEFAAGLDHLSPGSHLAVAVSGGADSLALLVLAAEWARARPGVRITALTVDHGLRPGAAAEAAHVAAVARALDAGHAILRWQGRKPRTGLQAAARAARYRLMAEWCAQSGVRDILLAHTLDDQAETILMRLASGSGLDGLAAMAPDARLPVPSSETHGVRLLRPLLNLPKARLMATLAARGIGWCEDTSNEDAGFERVRLRQAAGLLAREGLTPARLARTAARLNRARKALDAHAAALSAEAVTIAPTGEARVVLALLLSAPEETALRALAGVLAMVGGEGYHPRLERLEHLFGDLAAGRLIRARTLGGCRIAPKRLPGGAAGLLITREQRNLDAVLALEPGGSGLWDRRFRVSLDKKTRSSGEVRGLTDTAWQVLKTTPEGMALARLPAVVRQTLPALWRNGEPVALPVFAGMETAATAAPFRAALAFPPEKPI